MPHLIFDLDFAPPPDARRRFGEAVVRAFGEVMDTGTDHVAVVVRAVPHGDLVFGRGAGSSPGSVLLNADIRKGRTKEQKRTLALAIMDEAHRAFGVAKEAVYVVFTEHDGENFQLVERVLPSWSPGEDPLHD